MVSKLSSFHMFRQPLNSGHIDIISCNQIIFTEVEQFVGSSKHVQTVAEFPCMLKLLLDDVRLLTSRSVETGLSILEISQKKIRSISIAIGRQSIVASSLF